MPKQTQNFINPKQKQYGHLWHAEADRYEYDEDDWAAAECAELADELVHHRIAAEEDPEFDELLEEWSEYLWEYNLRLALEQSCHEGVLLPSDQRAIRLISCPEDMLQPLRWFFRRCPRHVRSHLALVNYVVIRSERARRTGSPEWRPETAEPAPEERAFFRPPVLKFRNYAR